LQRLTSSDLPVFSPDSAHDHSLCFLQAQECTLANPVRCSVFLNAAHNWPTYSISAVLHK
jgi:hypothetical protein